MHRGEPSAKHPLEQLGVLLRLIPYVATTLLPGSASLVDLSIQFGDPNSFRHALETT